MSNQCVRRAEGSERREALSPSRPCIDTNFPTSTYNRYWAETNEKLVQQLEYETPNEPALVAKDRESASHHLAVLYVRYIQIFRKLEVERKTYILASLML